MAPQTSALTAPALPSLHLLSAPWGPFALHVDHHVPVACGGATEAGNLEAVQHHFNHYKRDRCGLGLGHGLGW